VANQRVMEWQYSLCLEKGIEGFLKKVGMHRFNNRGTYPQDSGSGGKEVEVIARLSIDSTREFPEVKAFSPRNLNDP